MTSDYQIQLENARDALVATLAAGDDVVEYEIRGRRKRVEGRYELVKALALLRRQIALVGVESTRASHGRVRNLAIFSRR